MRAILAVGLAGCDLAFPVNLDPDTATVIDALPLVDSDPATCWDLNQLFNDEDHDRIVDGCDNCPLDPNGPESDSQADGDGDGVGDVCDPHPAANVERLAFFDPMIEIDPQVWEQLGGVWMVDTSSPDHGFQQTSPTGLALMATTILYENPVIELRMRDGMAVAGADVGVVAVTSTALDANPTDGRACMVVLDGPSNEKLRVVERVNSTDNAAVKPFPGVDDITLRFAANELAILPSPPHFTGPTCIGAHASGGMVTESLTATGMVITPRVGLWTRNAAATFTAVAIIEVMPGAL